MLTKTYRMSNKTTDPLIFNKSKPLQTKNEKEFLTYNEKIELYSEKAKNGDAESQYKLGMLYYNTVYPYSEKPDFLEYIIASANQGYKESIKMLTSFKDELEKLSGVNNVIAKYYLALYYYYGYGVKQNYIKAINMFKKLSVSYYADISNALNSDCTSIRYKSYYILGLSYLNGKGVSKDYIKAAIYFGKLYNNDKTNLEIKNYLKICYEKIIKDQNTYFKNENIININTLAQYYHEILIEKNNKLEESNNKILTNDKIYKNEDNALDYFFEYYKKGYVDSIKYIEILSKYGNEKAMYYLAICYYNGYCVEKNENKTLEILEQLVNNGNNYDKPIQLLGKSFNIENSNIEYFLGICYIKRNKNDDIDKGIRYLFFSVIDNNQEALKYLKELADKGNEKALEAIKNLSHKGNNNAMYYLAVYYYEGKIIKKDINKSLDYFYESAKQNNNDAFKYIKTMAEENNKKAEYYLGLCYYYGYSTNFSYNEAVNYFIKSSKEETSKEETLNTIKIDGNKDAMYYLGYCYYFGHGVKKDDESSAYWLYSAAKQDQEKAKELFKILIKLKNKYAEYYLGLYYYNNQNDKESYYWFKKSYRHGNKKALEYINILNNNHVLKKTIY